MDFHPATDKNSLLEIVDIERKRKRWSYANVYDLEDVCGAKITGKQHIGFAEVIWKASFVEYK